MYSSQHLYIYFYNMVKDTERAVNKLEYKISKSINNKYFNVKKFEIQEIWVKFEFFIWSILLNKDRQRIV